MPAQAFSIGWSTLVPNEITTDEKVYRKLVDTWQLRMMRSQSAFVNQRASFVRLYKRYRQIKNAALDPDEPNINLGYVFGLVEQINSKTVEPILALRPPCPVYPKKQGDQDAAKNFENIARSWYAQPHVQSNLRKSKKEMVITGTRFEIDEWQNVQRDGKRWGKVPKVVEVQQKDANGQPMFRDDKTPVMVKTVVQVDAEVPTKIPIHYGFHTRYPRIFNCYPEPDRPTIGTGQPTDCSWFVEDMGELSLEEMAREFYIDPVTKQRVNTYDFSKLLKDAGSAAEERYAGILKGESGIEDAYAPLIRPVKSWSTNSDFGQEDKDSVVAAEGSVDRAASEDRDKISVKRGYQADELITLAQDKYIIQRIKNPSHVPVMSIRSESLVPDPEFIYGKGAIEPIEDELDMMNDICNLNMSQLIRIVGKLMLIHVDKIVSMNDFSLGAGGKVRIQDTDDVRSAAMELQQTSSTREMLEMESYIKGEIEFTSSNMDGSMGVMGTKQGHKTKAGLEMVMNNLSPRFTTIHGGGIINEALRMQSMARFFEQYAFEKMPYDIVNEDGSTTYATFNKDDINTQGRGFRFGVEVDPSFGDSHAQKQESLDCFELGLKYEEIRHNSNDPHMKKLDLPKLYEKVLTHYGWRDVSGIFTLDNKEVSPDQELQILAQGGAAECNGNLMEHITSHMLQLESPKLKQMVEAGKASPDTAKRLMLMIDQAKAKMMTFMRDPQAAANAKKNQVMMSHMAQQ